MMGNLDTLITLPNGEAMLDCLLAVNDDKWLQERFYPVVVSAMAGKEVFPAGVALGLRLAISQASSGSPQIQIVVGLLFDDYVDALIAGSSRIS